MASIPDTVVSKNVSHSDGDIDDNMDIHSSETPTDNNMDLEVDSVKGVLSSLFSSSNQKAVEMPVSKYAAEYKMDHKKRGVALIFNHKKFNSRLNLKIRNGTDKDRDGFKTALGFVGFTDIIIHNDLSQKEVDLELKRVAEEVDHTHNDCLVVAMFTHGEADCVYTNNDRMRPEKLWEPFIANKCPTLAGKPKLFFIQACQGDRVDSGLIARSMDTVDSTSTYKIPSYADFLIHYSTIPGFYSWRNTTDGSWFIQALCNVLLEFGQQYDLLTLLTLVNQSVALDFESNVPDNLMFHKKKQIPCFTSMLTRRVYFPVKRTV